MKELHSEIEIDASAERVWGVLTDFASYSQWNPFIRRIGGKLKVGERLEDRLQPPDSRSITLRPKVLRAESNRLMLAACQGSRIEFRYILSDVRNSSSENRAQQSRSAATPSL